MAQAIHSRRVKDARCARSARNGTEATVFKGFMHDRRASAGPSLTAMMLRTGIRATRLPTRSERDGRAQIDGPIWVSSIQSARDRHLRRSVSNDELEGYSQAWPWTTGRGNVGYRRLKAMRRSTLSLQWNGVRWAAHKRLAANPVSLAAPGPSAHSGIGSVVSMLRAHTTSYSPLGVITCSTFACSRRCSGWVSSV
jgi:hypothetical protein